MKMRWTLAMAAAMAAGCGEKGPAGPESNRAPEIRNLTVSPAVIPLGGTAIVSVEASDPDGDQMFYRFEAGAGSITADAAQPSRATYRNDGAVHGSDQVRVTVTDSKNASASGNPATVIASRLAITPPNRASAGMTAADVISPASPRSSASVAWTKAPRSNRSRAKVMAPR